MEYGVWANPVRFFFCHVFAFLPNPKDFGYVFVGQKHAYSYEWGVVLSKTQSKYVTNFIYQWGPSCIGNRVKKRESPGSSQCSIYLSIYLFIFI